MHKTLSQVIPQPKGNRYSAALACVVGGLLLLSGNAYATSAHGPYAQNDFGGVGLLQTPTARMNAYGEFSINYSDTNEYRRSAVSLQVFPWLTATARYTDIRNRLYSEDPNFSGDQTLKDKAFDGKLLLWQESQYIPQIALGLQDVGGTGIFSAEYFVANKRWDLDSFGLNNWGGIDVSLGIGWGYLGQRDNITNPFCEIADRMCEREAGFSGRGGKFEIDKWFRGPAAIFGGIQYDTPIQGLSLMAEYEGNNYRYDRAGVPIVPDSPWNFGVHYALNPNVSMKLGYERGNTFTFGFTFNFNFNELHQLKIEPEKRQAQAESESARPTDWSQVNYVQLANDLIEEAGWSVGCIENELNGDGNRCAQRAIQVVEQPQGAVVEIAAQQARFRDTDDAVDRAARILSDSLPRDGVAEYRITEYQGNLGLATHVIHAPAFETAYRGERFFADEQDAIRTTSAQPMQERLQLDEPYWNKNRFGWAIQPDLEQSFGNAEAFYMYQLSLKAVGWYVFDDSLMAVGEMGINLMNNYDKFNYLIDGSDTPLPRVRTRVREYAESQDVWVNSLYLYNTHHLSKNVYAAAYAGYLERMFGGVGAELLHQAPNSRWAYGFDINYVKQRDPYRDFGFDDYEAFTGHASVYWRPTWLENTTLIARAGRFLAKDDGVHLELQHEFDSGIIAGAFAAFTNVSSEDFGEGSFTKGFYLSIPFDLFMLRRTKSRGTIAWMPIMRDGGQLLGRPQLYR